MLYFNWVELHENVKNIKRLRLFMTKFHKIWFKVKMNFLNFPNKEISVHFFISKLLMLYFFFTIFLYFFQLGLVSEYQLLLTQFLKFLNYFLYTINFIIIFYIFYLFIYFLMIKRLSQFSLLQGYPGTLTTWWLWSGLD